MIFIFDWGYTTLNNIGPLSAEDADFDLDAEYVFLVEEKTWFRLFFIPTIITGRKYFFKDADSQNIQAIDKAKFEKYKPLAILNMKSMKDEISEQDYHRQRSNL